MSIAANISAIKQEVERVNVKLVAISKTKPVEDILEAYTTGSAS